MKDSYLYQDKGKILGYYLKNLGEGLIMAQDRDAGIELMKLRTTYQDRFVLPAGNRFAVEFLLQNGFRVVDQATRMFYGEGLNWSPFKLFNRIAGNLG